MARGGVEGLVGYARRNFMVPIPRFATWEEFNLWLETQCRKRQADVLRGQSETIGQRLARDLAAMSELSAAPFDACDQTTGQVSSQALVRYKRMQVLELARCGWTLRRENVIALGPSGTGKTHVALGHGLAARQKGLSVGFTTAAALVNELMEARDERRLLRLQKQMAGYKLFIIDELGFVPLSKTGAELMFELISQRCERGATLITSNLPFEEWTETFGSERLAGALLDRLTHHVSIPDMNGDCYRLGQSRASKDASIN